MPTKPATDNTEATPTEEPKEEAKPQVEKTAQVAAVVTVPCSYGQRGELKYFSKEDFKGLSEAGIVKKATPALLEKLGYAVEDIPADIKE